MSHIQMSTETEKLNYSLARKRFFRTIPLYLIIPVLFLWGLHVAGNPVDWATFVLGAAGWVVALVLRVPVTLAFKRLPQKKLQTVVILSSGPLEEGVRLAALAVVGFTLPAASSLGQGWAAIEVVYAVINGLLLASLLTRNDEKAMQARAALEQIGMDPNKNKSWAGPVERISASAYHIGAALLIAANPWLVFIAVLVHSLFNLTMTRLAKQSIAIAELFAFVIGSAMLITGWLINH
jgi:hypothetical protein